MAANPLDVETRTSESGGSSEWYGFASQPSIAVEFQVPPGACDCLTHIYGDTDVFPMAPDRTYTPELASIGEIRRLHRSLGIDRAIIVQPTIYGTENACTIDAVRQLGAHARGIAVVDEDTPQAALAAMDDAGVRGLRINLETVGLTDPAIARRRFELAAEQVRHRRGWHIQVYTRPAIIEAIADLLKACPVPVAFDHFAGIQADAGIDNRGCEILLSLLTAGKAYVKLSAPYLASRQFPRYPDLVPIAKTLIQANRDQILWATNWPHPNAGRGENRKPTEIIPLRKVDDGQILNLLPVWAPDAKDRHAILVDNPARLYGF